MDLEKTGELLSRLRKECGMTQKQVAEKLQISDRTVSKWERGHSNPDIEMLQNQPVDQGWRKEILKRVIWLAIAGLMMLISSSLIRYGNELAKDTFIVPSWVWWLGLVVYPMAYAIIGEQIMALLWHAYGKQIAGTRWVKTVFGILIGAVVVYVIVMTVECIRYGYEQWVYRKIVENMKPGDSVSFMDTTNGCGFSAGVPAEWRWQSCGLRKNSRHPAEESDGL